MADKDKKKTGTPGKGKSDKTIKKKDSASGKTGKSGLPVKKTAGSSPAPKKKPVKTGKLPAPVKKGTVPSKKEKPSPPVKKPPVD
ncbi:MAG TPA: hypothetical protein PK200_06975, partial [Spirochaetota bacterium]|nr:hypothetical protein [Spirochaetota bacterium]